MRVLKCFILLFVFLLNTAPALRIAAQESHQSVGLVLSGGGAKGIAHIGAIKALEDNNIPIDYITGTSMGAIVGALYAIGYTPDEMMAFINSPYFGYMSTGSIDPEYTYYFSAEQPSPQLFSIQVGGDSIKTKKRFNPQSLISPAPMQFGFMEIFGAYTAQCRGNFDRLFVPLRTVASNMTKRRKHVFAGGNLADAVRASMSFPLVFQAVKIGDDIFYDGGIYDNFPVDVMRKEFAPSVMIGFDVSAPSEGPPNSYMDQLDMLVSDPQTYDLPEKDGVKVRIRLSEFSLLDFGAAQQIYEKGYRRTMEMMDSIKARVHSRISPEVRRIRRESFKMQTPELRFSDVTVSGADPRQNEYIKYLFTTSDHSDTIGVDHARLAFYRALASDKLDMLSPNAVPIDSTGLFKLNLDIAVKKKISLGAGAYITSSNNSFLYLRAGYSSLSFSSVNADIEAWIGQSYMAGALKGSLYLPTDLPSAMRFTAVASRQRFHENEKLFFKDNEPSFVTDHEYFGRLAWSCAAGRKGAAEVGVGGGRIYNSFYRNNDPESYIAGRDNIGINLAQVFAGYSSSTIDEYNYPTSGYDRHGCITALIGKSHFFNAMADSHESENEKWVQLHWRERDYFDLAKHFSLGLEGEIVASTRPLLQSYYATISTAPAFTPTPASHYVFDPGLRAPSYAAVSLVPIYKYNSSLSARLTLSSFIPARTIVETNGGFARYGRWFGTAHFFGEFSVAYKLPIATLSAYCNYTSSRHHFNAGISLGLFILAPKFIQ